uniref:Putative orf79.2 protein n=1 Tax=Chondrus crispus TaxID=2769 RepID=Q36332_CHOCR|nr:putative orf79.2 [Chondrus crispus]
MCNWRCYVYACLCKWKFHFINQFFLFVISYVHLMTWCNKRIYFWRSSYRNCTARTKIRSHFIYYIWNFIFLCFFLSFFS